MGYSGWLQISDLSLYGGECDIQHISHYHFQSCNYPMSLLRRWHTTVHAWSSPSNPTQLYFHSYLPSLACSIVHIPWRSTVSMCYMIVNLKEPKPSHVRHTVVWRNSYYKMRSWDLRKFFDSYSSVCEFEMFASGNSMTGWAQLSYVQFVIIQTQPSSLFFFQPAHTLISREYNSTRQRPVFASSHDNSLTFSLIKGPNQYWPSGCLLSEGRCNIQFLKQKSISSAFVII